MGLTMRLRVTFPLMLAPVLAGLLLVTALAAGLSQGAMLRADAAPAWLDLCGGDDGAAGDRPCLDCTLVVGMASCGPDLAAGVAPVERLPAGGDLVAAAARVAGGGARAPPEWV